VEIHLIPLHFQFPSNWNFDLHLSLLTPGNVLYPFSVPRFSEMGIAVTKPCSHFKKRHLIAHFDTASLNK